MLTENHAQLAAILPYDEIAEYQEQNLNSPYDDDKAKEHMAILHRFSADARNALAEAEWLSPVERTALQLLRQGTARDEIRKMVAIFYAYKHRRTCMDVELEVAPIPEIDFPGTTLSQQDACMCPLAYAAWTDGLYSVGNGISVEFALVNNVTTYVPVNMRISGEEGSATFAKMIAGIPTDSSVTWLENYDALYEGVKLPPFILSLPEAIKEGTLLNPKPYHSEKIVVTAEQVRTFRTAHDEASVFISAWDRGKITPDQLRRYAREIDGGDAEKVAKSDS